MATALVLAAGLGTRLAPLTAERPKALAPWGDGLLIDAALGALRAAGHGEILVNAHHLAEQVVGALAGRAGVGVAVEPALLGTAGPLRALAHRLRPPVVVWNADVLVEEPNLPALVAAAGEGMALLVAPRAPGEGTVGLAPEGRLARLRGERFGTEVVGADYVGVAALGAGALARAPEVGCLIGDLALPWLRAGAALRTVPTGGAWLDAGTLSGHLRSNLAWLARRGLTSWVAPDADVSPGVELRDVVVGSGACVTGAGRVVRAVVWPGAELRAPASDVIVTPRAGVVLVPSGK